MTPPAETTQTAQNSTGVDNWFESSKAHRTKPCVLQGGCWIWVVEAGVELYELRPDAAVKPQWETPPNVGGYLGLHAKLYTIDRAKPFLGSVNLDPRSKFINTETGILVENAELAQRTADAIEKLTTPDNAWHVGIDQDGHVTWTDATGTTRQQPARSVWQRIADRVFEVLPIDPYI